MIHHIHFINTNNSRYFSLAARMSNNETFMSLLSEMFDYSISRWTVKMTCCLCVCALMPLGGAWLILTSFSASSSFTFYIVQLMISCCAVNKWRHMRGTIKCWSGDFEFLMSQSTITRMSCIKRIMNNYEMHFNYEIIVGAFMVLQFYVFTVFHLSSGFREILDDLFWETFLVNLFQKICL